MTGKAQPGIERRPAGPNGVLGIGTPQGGLSPRIMRRSGALVGGPAAGTNGGMDPFDVAGGHTLRWTGMDIRKKDGPPHLGVGIKPTVPVSRTLAGVIAGRDELLEKAIEVVSQR
jgi:C-terminal processing protease CtpA/Prc